MRRVRVMVIEDDAAIRDMESDILAFEGYEVMTAVHGQDALDQLKSGPCPDLIVLDVTMPVMDGVCFRRRQMEQPALSEIPVVVASAVVPLCDMPGTRQIRKPFGIAEFLGAIDHELRRRAQAGAPAAADPLRHAARAA